MESEPRSPSARTSDRRDLHAVLEGRAGPAWIIVPATGTVVAATAAGWALLGQPAVTGPGCLVLDAATPGLALIRAHGAASGAGSAEASPPVRLVLWGARGAITLAATQIERLDADHVLVDAGASPGWVAASESAGRDRATLAAIAARIRAGLDARLEPPMSRADLEVGGAGRAAPKGAALTEAGGADGLGPVLRRLAHELRTPLSAIAAMAEVVRDERLGPDARDRYKEYADNIHDSARHALALVSAMLDPAMVDQRAPTPTFAQIDVNGLVAACAGSMRSLSEEAGLTLETVLAARLPQLVAEPRALRQIVLNLLSNAVKFTPRGGRITVSTSYELDGPLSVSVADTGGGIAADVLQAVRARMEGGAIVSEERRPGGGHGIGLPLTAALARQSGGGVLIESRAGEGTRVTVVFAKARVVPV